MNVIFALANEANVSVVTSVLREGIVHYRVGRMCGV